ncbi:hypothetical protein Ppa06_17850 [Planomonospora parontospora subsp. parontospora]|uniref:Uncharacterized protein n=2 Tax=Planomonospora parontospora TaxID=58119 RepID=A0AA37BEI9_9ACTN|nr:hypothetical protein GCM10010126_18420 [Planomonospora parontospora]GII07987.1 hypothetical protein Ppa06_17850 [Planomonospora parontospora subsp. parontospora]
MDTSAESPRKIPRKGPRGTPGAVRHGLAAVPGGFSAVRRGILAVAAVLVPLALAGCAPSAAEPFVPVDGAAGTAAASGPSAPSPGADGTPRAGRSPRAETVQAGPDMRLVVEPPVAADAVTDGAVAAFRAYYAGSLRIVSLGDRDPTGSETAYLDLLGEEAVRQDYDWVASYWRDHHALHGTVRLYGFVTEPLAQGGVRLSACVDMAGTRTVDTRTGREVTPRDAWMAEPFLHAADLREDGGVLRIQSFNHALYPSEDAKRCLR